MDTEQTVKDAQIARNAWQPIATAPMDGTEVLIGLTNTWVFAARWIEGEGWYEVNNDPTDHWGQQWYPTHWMHFPNPPTRKET